jgi:serine/threonine protein kinase
MDCEIVVRLQVPPVGEESLFASKIVDQVSWLVTCSHPCLLKFFGWSFPTESSPGQIGMEYAANGNLREFLCQHHSVDDTERTIIICGIVQGMKYLHKQGIIHRDLRPETIFVDHSGSPKIGGFEKARLLSVDLNLTGGGNCSLYLAPELYGTENVEELAPAVDVYSFGLILYELIVGRPVFLPNTPLKKLHSLASGTERPEFPSRMQIGLKQIIHQSWSADPMTRNSFDIIWQQLEGMNFELTSKVDVPRVIHYIRQITRV